MEMSVGGVQCCTLCCTASLVLSPLLMPTLFCSAICNIRATYIPPYLLDCCRSGCHSNGFALSSFQLETTLKSNAGRESWTRLRSLGVSNLKGWHDNHIVSFCLYVWLILFQLWSHRFICFFFIPFFISWWLPKFFCMLCFVSLFFLHTGYSFISFHGDLSACACEWLWELRAKEWGSVISSLYFWCNFEHCIGCPVSWDRLWHSAT